MSAPAIYNRAKKLRATKAQSGTIVSFTKVMHPPAGFGNSARVIALIELADGTRVMGHLVDCDYENLKIGQSVAPQMRLGRVEENSLRVYDIAYTVTADVPVSAEVSDQEFKGYILALTGPSGVGKSTISKLLTRIASDYAAPVPIYTTRKEKKGDNGEYLYVDAKKFKEMQASGEIIASTDIPATTEDRWYGYRAADFESIWQHGKIPVVITEQSLLEELSLHYGRKSILSFGLLPPGNSKRARLSALLHRLRSRGRDTEASIADRMKNAEDDLRFLTERKELFDHLVVNDELEVIIDTLKDHVLAIQANR